MIRFSKAAVLVGMVVMAGAGTARARPICTPPLAQAADSAMGELTNWAAVASWYKRFDACMDAGIAEGVGAKVVGLLADHWDTLPDLAAEIRRTPGFQRFVVLNVSAISDAGALEKIHRQAEQSCPTGRAALCKAIRDQAARSIKEQAG